MIRVVFIKPDGEVQHIIEPSHDGQYEDAVTNEDGYFQKHVAYDVDIADLATNSVWDFDSGEWVSRSARPSGHHIWTATGWALNTEKMWQEIRNERDIRLRRSDWTQMPDSPVSSDSWRAYRQALRDIPVTNANVTNVEEVSWPAEPAS